jgi:2,4-dienoyl-CoA reductase-like NADH-dependent reductase (Old Yellow Enzyme family)
MVVTEGSAVSHPVAHETDKIPNFYGESLPRWRKVATGVHEAGAVIFAQLWHTGRYRSRAETWNPDEPSIGPMASKKGDIRAMTDSDIADVIDAFTRSALSARELGFDGIEVHGAHGYLPDQFFWPLTNRREDRYGGPIENRVRFSVELVSAIRQAVGREFPIMFRFSQFKGLAFDAKIASTPAELEAWLQPLADAGVDIFDASTRRFWLPEFEGSELNLAGWAKKVTGKASMTVGSVGLETPLVIGNPADSGIVATSKDNLKQLATMFNRGDFDLVALGRIILSNPEWPQIVRQQEFARVKPYDPAAVAQRLECAHVA